MQAMAQVERSNDVPYPPLPFPPLPSLSTMSYEIAADLSDDEDLIATPSQSLLPSSGGTKGKGRATSPGLAVDPLAGRIGSGTGGVGERTSRSTAWGGIQTETRYVAS